VGSLFAVTEHPHEYLANRAMFMGSMVLQADGGKIGGDYP
jgi:hypothetical protein